MDDLTALALDAQAGDERALAALVRRTQPDVWRLCAHLVGRERADDLTQETFVRMWRSLGRYRVEAGVRTWLLAIARHACIDALRAASRRPRLGVAGPVPEPVEADPAGAVTTEAVLDSLPPDQRLALFLTQLLGLSYAEAAEVSGVAVGTIRSRVARGREELAGRLGHRAAR